MDWSTIFPGSLFGMGQPPTASATEGAAPPPSSGTPTPAGGQGAISPQAANMMAQYGQRMLPQAPQAIPLQPIHFARAPGLLNQY